MGVAIKSDLVGFVFLLFYAIILQYIKMAKTLEKNLLFKAIA